MSCQDFERELEEAEDYTNPSPTLEAHRRNCVSCSDLLEDFNHIRRQARLLLASEPPDRVWQQLQRHLGQSGLVAQPSRRRFFGEAAVPGWFSRLSMGMAYAAVFVVALGVTYVYSIFTHGVPVPPPYGPATAASTLPLPPPPDQPFNQVIEKVPPAQRAVYVNNLNQVENS